MKKVLRRLRSRLAAGTRSIWWLVRRTTGVGCGPLVVHDAVDGQIGAPDGRDVFAFRATVTFTWRSDGLTETKLDEAIARYRRDAQVYVSQQLTRHARQHQANEGSALERAINAEFAAHPLRYVWWAVPVTCQPELIIRIDPNVAEEIRRPLLDKLRQETEHDQQMRWADIVDERSRYWSTLLEKLSDQPRISDAARLTNDAKLAEVLAESVTTRQTELAAALQTMRQLLDNTKEWGYGQYEWVANAERVVRHQLHELGIVPEGSDGDPSS